VSRASCAVVAKEMGLGDWLLETGENAVSREELERLADNRNVLAALLEAALAALFLEHGFEPIEQAIVAAFSQRIDYAFSEHVDYKTELQEALARRGMHVNYVIVEVSGPAHERFFTCAAMVDGEEMGRGSGNAKKQAEQSAAEEVLAKLEA
jgi:ribonuclease-3